MKFFHRTSGKNVESILKRGFQNGTGTCMMAGIKMTGVWVSDRPSDGNDGAVGDTVLQVELPPTKKTLNKYEVVEQGKPYCERCFPAALLNKGKISIAQTVLINRISGNRR